ncbi:MAG: ATP-binding protein [bacterium]|nr:ATP-binding protein [bacterium]
MNPFSIPPIISALLFLFLGGFIYLKERKSKVHFAFLLICITTVWWQVSWFFLFNTQREALAEILVKVGHIGIILLPVTFLHFVVSFLGKTDGFKRAILYLSYLAALFFEISLFVTDNFISSYYRYSWGFYPKAGFLHPLYLAFIGILLMMVVYMLLSALKKETKDSLKRSQIEYILIAIIFYTFASSDFVVNYGFEFYPVGFIPLLFFLGAIGYAIARYRLMDVRVILTEFLVATIAFVLLVQVFTAQTTFEYAWKGALFLAFLLLGYLLIKSVLQEIKRRKELQHLYKEVDRLSKTKSEFISIASHQLRTPLSAIKGYISLIAEGIYGKVSDKLAKPLENVYQSNERLIRLVNDILNLSRLEAGKIGIKMEPTSLTEIITSVAEELKVNAEKKRLKLKIVKPSEPLPKVIIDQEKIRQVILNIIDNAIKYTKRGEIKIGLEKTDSKVRVAVSDTGEGMTEKEIKKLFQMFSRSKNSIKLHTEGTGIGLYIAKKFVEMHKGRLWAESRGMGKGSTFFIELPIK